MRTRRHTPFDYLRCVLTGISTELGWQDAPDLQEWLDGSRLNLLHGLADGHDAAGLRELQGRFFQALFPALEQLELFAEQATPQERSRMFDPGTYRRTPGSRPRQPGVLFCRSFSSARVTHVRDPLGEHASIAVTGAPAALAYLTARFAGNPPSTTGA